MGSRVIIDKARQTATLTDTATPTAPGADELILWVGANASGGLSYVEVDGAVHKITNALRSISTPLPGAGTVTQGGVEFGAERDHLKNVAVATDATWSATESTVDVAYGETFLNGAGQSITSAVDKALHTYRDAVAKKAA